MIEICQRVLIAQLSDKVNMHKSRQLGFILERKDLLIKFLIDF